MPDANTPADITDKPAFFVGIGGSGMMPLAMILAAKGASVAGSDRSLDQARLPAKFDYLRDLGVELFPQDGSGITSSDQVVIASAAIEPTVPDMVAAERFGCARRTRAEMLADLFNDATMPIGVARDQRQVDRHRHDRLDPARDAPRPDGDERRGDEEFRHPQRAVRQRAGRRRRRVRQRSRRERRVDRAVRPARRGAQQRQPRPQEPGGAQPAVRRLHRQGRAGGDQPRQSRRRGAGADVAGAQAWSGSGSTATPTFTARDIEERPFGASFTLAVRGHDPLPVELQVPGRHNISNALAAIAAARCAGVALDEAALAIGGFTGLRRRFEFVGETQGVAVLDDFGHNPDKIAATLTTLHAFPGRLLILFQPHGYGPLKVMRRELVEAFAEQPQARRRADPARPGLLRRHRRARGDQRRHRRRPGREGLRRAPHRRPGGGRGDDREPGRRAATARS